MLVLWLGQESSSVQIFLQLLEIGLMMTVGIGLIAMCKFRRDDTKDLNKASTIVSMPEVRRFKLDPSEKETQQEVEVDLDEMLDGGGGIAADNPSAEKHMVAVDAKAEKNQPEEQMKKLDDLQKKQQKGKVKDNKIGNILIIIVLDKPSNAITFRFAPNIIIIFSDCSSDLLSSRESR
ncbi:unnamed protein product [Thelazia callipaeda]|uniref:Uncharacterized protein n=1 Tax=Thelazia callipaeda TaxID=103827 RepID=A0A0N5D695_THECL|nr:unnamed protein product [Thelazia callipaeda]